MKVLNASFVLCLVSLFASSAVANTWQNATVTLLSNNGHYKKHVDGKFGELFTNLHINILLGVPTTVNKVALIKALKPVFGHGIGVFRAAEVAKLPIFIDAALVHYKTPASIEAHLEAFLVTITSSIIADITIKTQNNTIEKALGPPLILATRASLGKKYTKAIGATILANVHNTVVLWRTKQIATFCIKLCAAVDWGAAITAVVSAKY